MLFFTYIVLKQHIVYFLMLCFKKHLELKYIKNINNTVFIEMLVKKAVHREHKHSFSSRPSAIKMLKSNTCYCTHCGGCVQCIGLCRFLPVSMFRSKLHRFVYKCVDIYFFKNLLVNKQSSTLH